MSKNESVKMLVIGMGEIGKSIFRILSKYYDTYSYDQSDSIFEGREGLTDVIHICFGHKENEIEEFKKWVRNYQKRFLKEDGLTIIHSTVAIGVCNDLDVVHSPIIGQHPYLYQYIKKATKIFAGKRAYEAAEYFRRIGMKVLIYENAKESEAAKLLLTENYRVNIEFCQRVKRLCDKYNLNFHNVYTLPAGIYNNIYKQMDHEEYIRPILHPIPGPFGGHCIAPNQKLISLSE